MVVRHWMWVVLALWCAGCGSTTATPSSNETSVVTKTATPAAVTLPRLQPLQPWQGDIVVSAGDDGPVDIIVYDAQQREIARIPATVVDGVARVEVLPQGAVGVATAVVVRDQRPLQAAVSLYQLDPQSTVQTDDRVYTTIFTKTVQFISQSMRTYPLNGVMVRGYRSPDNPLLWLRDHVYQGRGFRYFEADVTSLLEAFRDAQRADGSLPDWIDMPELGVKSGRKEVESDLEFLYVQGIYEAWQMTGDHTWMQAMLPSARRAMTYTTSDPLRWNAELGLVRRPYTIDMWDFEYGDTTTNPETGQAAPRHWIDDKSVWGIFHGDNTGVIYALRLLATMEDAVGNTAAAETYREQADAMHTRLLKLSWNGNFFTHFVPEDPTWRAEGVEMDAQLSISNAYALNRGILRKQETQFVLNSYYARGQARPDVVLPWFSIDPPFPAYAYGMAGRKGELPGEYVNGGIMPLVGGELARAAFGNDYEPFGFDTLRHYAVLIERFGGSYLWYYPNGQPGISGPDTVPYDGWGASAMLAALMEGAAGVYDVAYGYEVAQVIPRWVFDPAVRSAYVVARSAAAQGYVAYQWQRRDRQVLVRLTGSGSQVKLQIPLPPDAPATVQVTLDGERLATPPILDTGRTRAVIIDASRLSHLVVVDW